MVGAVYEAVGHKAEVTLKVGHMEVAVNVAVGHVETSHIEVAVTLEVGHMEVEVTLEVGHYHEFVVAHRKIHFAVLTLIY